MNAQGLVHLGDADGAAQLLTGLLSRIETESWLLRARALSWRSAAFRITEHFAEARNDVQAAIHLLEQHGGPEDVLGDAYRRLGVILADQGKFKSAISYLRRALKHFSSLLDVAQMAEAHNWLGVMYKRLGDLEKASTHLERARSEWLRAGNQGALAMALNNIAYIYQRRGQHDMALDTLNLGLEKARSAGYRRIEACLLVAKGEVLRDTGRYREALASYQQGLELAREVMESYYVVWAKAGLGETHRLLGDRDKAEVLVNEAVAQAKEQGQHYEATLFTAQLAVIQYERGDCKGSQETLSGVCQRLVGFGDKDALARAYFHLAQAAFLNREHDSALDWLRKASALADELGYDDFLAVEGRNAIMLIELAISRHLDEKRFLGVADKIRRRRVAPAGKADTGAEVGEISHCDIEAHCLGEVEVSIDSRRVAETEWRSQRAKEIFFYLLSSPAGRTKEEITADIWPDSPPAKATSNLHINLYRARRAIHPLVILTDGSRYRINPHLRVWFDVTEFNQLLNQAESSPLHDKCKLSSLEQAIQLYRGPFLSEVYSEWAERKRQDLEGKFLKALYLLARLDGENSQHARAISLLERFIAIDPYHDEVYCQLMEEHLALGDAVSASRTYKRYVEGVAREMDCLPSAHMRDLHLRLFTRATHGN